jgi:hypothetical protein
VIKSTSDPGAAFVFERATNIKSGTLTAGGLLNGTFK